MANRFAPGAPTLREGLDIPGVDSVEDAVDSWDDEWVNALDAIYEVEEGDSVLYGNRKQTLTVKNIGDDQNGRRYAALVGPSGGEVTVREQYNPNGTPDFRTDRGEDATNLRIVERQTPGKDGEDGSTDGSDGAGGATLDSGRTVGHRWPATPTDAKESDADSYLMKALDDPFGDYQDFLSRIGSPEAASVDGNPITEFFSKRSPTWTFVDEMLTFGEDIPRSVNNWRLIDYGIVTDENVDNTRHMAWFNSETDELLVLGAYNRGGGESPKWYVWHADDAGDVSDSEREVEVETDSRDEAFDTIRDYLYGDADEVDFSIVEDAQTGRVTIRDAISDTKLAEKVFGLKDTDPFGAREYVRSTDAYHFVQDADRALFLGIGAATNRAAAIRSRSEEWWEENRGQLGKLAKVMLVQALLTIPRGARMAADGLKRRFTGVAFAPIIKFDEIGVTAEYKYRHDVPDDPRDFSMRMTGNPLPLLTSKRLAGGGPKLKAGLAWLSVVEAAEWADVNEWVFEIPDPWPDEGSDSSGSSGRSRTVRAGSVSGTSAKSTSEVLSAVKNPDGRFHVEQGGSGPSDKNLSNLDSSLSRQTDDDDMRQVAHALCLAYVEEWHDIREKDLDENRTGSKVGDWASEASDTLSRHNIRESEMDEELIHDALLKMVNDGVSDPYRAVAKVLGTTPAETASESSSSGDDDPAVTEDDVDTLRKAAREMGGTSVEDSAEQTESPSSGAGDREMVDDLETLIAEKSPEEMSAAEKDEVEAALGDGWEDQVRVESLSPGEQEELQRIRHGGTPDTPEGLEDSGAVTGVSRMSDDDIEDAVGAMYGWDPTDGEDVGYEQRDDDRLP